ncbi:MAG: cyclase family protein [Bacteroidota bacterium]|nr:MAG: cyclase family protein [Bacteroidota bacterium]
MFKIIDLTHILEENMPVYPGTDSPRFISNCTHEKDGFAELLIQMQSHTGTHLDAPAHILPEGKSLSDFDAGFFCGLGLVFPLSHQEEMNSKTLEKNRELIAQADFILLHTQWDSHWGTPKYFEGFPAPSQKLLLNLLKFNLKGLGIDAISIDPVGSSNLPNHHIWLGSNRVIIENLTNLQQLPNQLFEFFCLPLPIKLGDGSPVRAIARTID